jgi:hypothetical protein
VRLAVAQNMPGQERIAAGALGCCAPVPFRLVHSRAVSHVAPMLRPGAAAITLRWVMCWTGLKRGSGRMWSSCRTGTSRISVGALSLRYNEGSGPQPVGLQLAMPRAG